VGLTRKPDNKAISTTDAVTQITPQLHTQKSQLDIRRDLKYHPANTYYAAISFWVCVKRHALPTMALATKPSRCAPSKMLPVFCPQKITGGYKVSPVKTSGIPRRSVLKRSGALSEA
jgi:hypothetical protein